MRLKAAGWMGKLLSCTANRQFYLTVWMVRHKGSWELGQVHKLTRVSHLSHRKGKESTGLGPMAGCTTRHHGRSRQPAHTDGGLGSDGRPLPGGAESQVPSHSPRAGCGWAPDVRYILTVDEYTSSTPYVRRTDDCRFLSYGGIVISTL